MDETEGLIGTQVDFEPEVTNESGKPKFQPVWQQEARDENNKRRFHGAFTGGFSAGYWNTVGSAEGWTPSQFVSSRKNRAQKVEQQLESFMDEDDIQEHKMGGKKLAATEEFASLRGDASAKRREPEISGSASLGFGVDFGLKEAMETLIVEATDTMGTKLLRLMGWKPGQGVGPKVQRKKAVIGPARPPSSSDAPAEEGGDDDEGDDEHAAKHMFAPKDVAVATFKHKDNLFGLGFDPHTDYPDFQAPVSKRVELDQQGRQSEKRARMSMLGMGEDESGAFGVGVFEDGEEDCLVYGKDKVEYDDVLDENEAESRLIIPGGKLNRKPKTAGRRDAGGDKKLLQSASLGSALIKSTGYDGRRVLVGFIMASRVDRHFKIYPPPTVPKEFTGRHVFAEPLKLPDYVRGGAELALKRAKMLGEAQLPEKKKEEINDDDKKRLASMLSNKFVSSSAPQPVSQALAETKLFKDAAKQERYDYFLDRLTNPRDAVAPSSYHRLSIQQRKEEDEEFASAVSTFRKGPNHISDTSIGGGSTEPAEALVITRSVSQFRPNKITCKRFNVPDPYLGASLAITSLQPRFGTQMDDLSLFSAPTASAIHFQNQAKMGKDELLAEQKSAAAKGLLGTLGKVMQEQRERDEETQGTGESKEGAEGQKEVTEETDPTLGEDEEPDADLKPPPDLFKEIFSWDSDDDEEDSGEGASGFGLSVPAPAPAEEAVGDIVSFYSALAAKRIKESQPKSIADAAREAVARLGLSRPIPPPPPFPPPAENLSSEVFVDRKGASGDREKKWDMAPLYHRRNAEEDEGRSRRDESSRRDGDDKGYSDRRGREERRDSGRTDRDWREGRLDRGKEEDRSRDRDRGAEDSVRDRDAYIPVRPLSPSPPPRRPSPPPPKKFDDKVIGPKLGPGAESSSDESSGEEEKKKKKKKKKSDKKSDKKKHKKKKSKK